MKEDLDDYFRKRLLDPPIQDDSQPIDYHFEDLGFTPIKKKSVSDLYFKLDCPYIDYHDWSSLGLSHPYVECDKSHDNISAIGCSKCELVLQLSLFD